MLKKILCMTLVIIQIMGCTVYASEERTVTIKRSNGNSYIKSSVTWTYTKTKVKESNAVQTHSGLLVEEKKTKRIITEKTYHKWSCKSGFYLGVKLPIGTIGYTKTWADMVSVKKGGDYTVFWDD